MTPSRKRRRGAFTLIEVLLVLVIITVIASLSVTAYSRIQENAYIKATQDKIHMLKTPLNLYRMDVGDFPSTQQALDALVQPPADLAVPEKWKGSYIEAALPILDPWTNPYQYEYPGTHQMGTNPTYDIWSFGPDGVNGTEDDIGSWTQE